MKGTSILAVAVCVVCFFLGYLAYLGAILLVDFMASRVAFCKNMIEACSPQGSEPGNN